MGSFQPRKPDLNKCNWQSHSAYITHTSFQEQGQPEQNVLPLQQVGRPGGSSTGLSLCTSRGMQEACGERRLRRHPPQTRSGDWGGQVVADTLGGQPAAPERVGRISEENC